MSLADAGLTPQQPPPMSRRVAIPVLQKGVFGFFLSGVTLFVIVETGSGEASRDSGFIESGDALVQEATIAGTGVGIPQIVGYQDVPLVLASGTDLEARTPLGHCVGIERSHQIAISIARCAVAFVHES